MLKISIYRLVSFYISEVINEKTAEGHLYIGTTLQLRKQWKSLGHLTVTFVYCLLTRSLLSLKKNGANSVISKSSYLISLVPSDT